MQAGFEVVGFVEYWKPAIETYKLNHPNTKHFGFDITKIPDATIKEYEGKIDVIIGGPPCQGFSMAGKRDNNDPRNKLYKHYLRFVKIIKPTSEKKNKVETRPKNLTQKRRLLKLVCLTNGWL